MRKFLLIAGLYAVCFSAYTQQTPSRIEKKNFSDVKEVRFDHISGNIVVTESTSKQVELEIQYFDSDELKPESKISSLNNILEIKTVPLAVKNRRENRRQKVGIDYIIIVPHDVAMKVNLKYGNMNMDDFHGDFRGDFVYGNLNAGVFFSSPVNISGKYSNIRIDEVDTLNLSIDYGNVKAHTINAFKVQSKYSNHKIDNATTVKAVCTYGRISIESVVDFDAELRYMPTSIENLDKRLKLKCAYSDFTVKKTSKDLTEIDFDGSYSNFKFALDDELSANLTVDLLRGNLSIDEKHNPKFSFSEESRSKLIKRGVIGSFSFSEESRGELIKRGVIGSKTPTANIAVSTSYAGVTIK
jgi:hypothetical protein